MPGPTPPRRRLAVALFAAGLAIVAPTAVAQDAAGRSLTATATAKVRDAAASALGSAQELASAALDLIGIRYKWGGETPETGLDCSGLVRYVFQQVTGTTLPRTAKDLSQVGEKVAIGDLRPGDLVFFNTRRFAFSHVGIYLGDNRFVHAPRRGREVEVAEMDSTFWKKRFNGARRIAAALPGFVPAMISTAEAAPAVTPSLAAIVAPAESPPIPASGTPTGEQEASTAPSPAGPHP